VIPVVVEEAKLTNALSIFLCLLLCIDNLFFSYGNLFSSTAQYQPLWTFVGAGLKTLDESKMAMKEVMPENAQWIKDSVASFNPDKNAVVLANGEAVSSMCRDKRMQWTNWSPEQNSVKHGQGRIGITLNKEKQSIRGEWHTN
jgi:hypothetical protein